MSDEKETASSPICDEKEPAADEDMSCCFLDEEKFRVCCHLLLQHSHSIRDGWTLEQGPDPEEVYLRKTTLRSGGDCAVSDQEQRGAGSGLDPLTSILTWDDQSQVELDQVALDDVVTEVVQYEYHIVYSCSYGTPVLYFRASTLEGRSLSLVEVWKSVHPYYTLRLQHNPWNSITQQEHPVLGQPFFMLHPCRTEEFMWPVMKAALKEHRQVNYLVTWLSVVGPVMGLDIPLSYSTQRWLLPFGLSSVGHGTPLTSREYMKHSTALCWVWWNITALWK